MAAYVARGVAESAWRYRARVIVHASAETMADRIGRWVGTIEPIGAGACRVDLGADNVETLAVYLGMLGTDFTIEGQAELAEQLSLLAERYRAAISA